MSKLDELVKEAVDIERELRSIENGRMSYAAWLRHCFKEGEFDPPKLARVGAKVNAGTKAFAGVRAWIANVAEYLSRGTCHTPPNDSLIRMNRHVDDARGELRELNANMWYAWALAVERAQALNTEAFGDVEDWPAHLARIAELKARRAELLPLFKNAWTADDVIISNFRSSDSSALITFRIAPGVTVGPLRDVGERLIASLLAA
jgi:hypothetical protein